MLHVLFVTLCFSCVIHAWSSYGPVSGFEPEGHKRPGGSRGRGRPTHIRHDNSTVTYQPHKTHQSSSYPQFATALAESSSASATQSTTAPSSQSSSVGRSTTSFTLPKLTTIDTSTTSTTQLKSPSPSITNLHATNLSTSPSSSDPMTAVTPTSVPQPSSTPSTSVAGDLGSQNSKTLIIVATIAPLSVIALAAFLIFRYYKKRRRVKFTPDRMVKSQNYGSFSKTGFGATYNSTSPLIVDHQSDRIPNPFASDLDYYDSSRSVLSFDATSDVSEVPTTLPGPSVHSCSPPTAVPEPIYLVDRREFGSR